MLYSSAMIFVNLAMIWLQKVGVGHLLNSRACIREYTVYSVLFFHEPPPFFEQNLTLKDVFDIEGGG